MADTLTLGDGPMAGRNLAVFLPTTAQLSSRRTASLPRLHRVSGCCAARRATCPISPHQSAPPKARHSGRRRSNRMCPRAADRNIWGICFRASATLRATTGPMAFRTRSVRATLCATVPRLVLTNFREIAEPGDRSGQFFSTGASYQVCPRSCEAGSRPPASKAQRSRTRMRR